MPIDPCVDGCLNHNMAATALPTAGDDPCNSAGNGYFCPGSFWYLAGGLVAGEDCDVLFLRTGGDCNVDQWLRIPVADLRNEIVDPVDGVDCCSAGTLWCNTVTGTYWISTNGCGGDLCTWCEICKEQLLISESSNIQIQALGFPAPVGFTTIGPASDCITVTNTSNRDLSFLWVVVAPALNIVNTNVAPAIVEFRTQISLDGGGTWNTAPGMQVRADLWPTGQTGAFQEPSGSGYNQVFTLTAGQSITLCIRNQWQSPDGSLIAGAGFFDTVYHSVFGVSI